jgi:prevent-host-death family protein
MSRRIQTAEARKDLAKVLERSARGERIKVTRYNRTAGILIGKEDLKRLEDCEQEKDKQKVRRGARRR